MQIIKGYCGYEKTLIPMRAARMKPQLDKRICTGDFGLTSYKDFIILLLFQKFWLPIERDIYNGDTEYLILDLLGTSKNGYKVNKTQYDFAVFLNQNFDDMDAIKAYDENEQQKQKERLGREQREQEEEKERAEERKAEALRFRTVIDDESVCYLGTAAETKKNEIYAKILKDTHPELNIAPLTLIALANHIDEEAARVELRNWLHTQNKASTKLFEWYTGVKLPKTVKARAEFIMDLRGKDLQKQHISPRAEYIAIPGGFHAIGIRFKYHNVSFYMYRDDESKIVRAISDNGQLLSERRTYNTALIAALQNINYLESNEENGGGNP